MIPSFGSGGADSNCASFRSHVFQEPRLRRIVKPEQLRSEWLLGFFAWPDIKPDSELRRRNFNCRLCPRKKLSGIRNRESRRKMPCKVNQVSLSLVIPTYNRADLIGPTLDSALNQSQAFFEVIVVDDGSSDYTQTVLENYAGRIQNIR